VSIYDGDFSQIKAEAVVAGSKVQAQNVLQAALDEIARLRKREAELVEALEKCADDFAKEIKEWFPDGSLKNPTHSKTYTTKMQPVFRARALLRAVKERDA